MQFLRRLLAPAGLGALALAGAALLAPAPLTASTFCANPPPPRFAPRQVEEYPDGADVVTCVQNGATEVWTIFDPYVSTQRVSYPGIPLFPGDVVEVKAEGCVQTGGAGETWKRYLVPLDSSGEAQQLYRARIGITGLTGRFQVGPDRIDGLGSLLHWTDGQWVVTQLGVLTLGYADDHYDDNGYYDHDDGNVGQCRNSFGTTVTVTLTRGASPGFARCDAAGGPPGPVAPGVPDFVRAAELLKANDVPLGLPATADTPGNGLRHFQLFQEGTADGSNTLPDKPLSSAEIQDEDGCLYLAVSPATAPLWYAVDLAFDKEFENAREARPWDPSLASGPSLATYGSVMDQNRIPSSGWRSTVRPGPCGGAGTAWRTSPPRWIRLCPEAPDPQDWNPNNVTGFPVARQDRLLESGRRCGWSIQARPSFNACTFIAHPEWAAIFPDDRITASGVVTNSFLSGDDFALNHNDVPGGGRYLGERREVDLHNDGVNRCAPFEADGGELCADWEVDLALDPDHRHRLAADESGDRRSDGIGIQAPNGISNDCLKLERWRQGNGMAGLKGTLGIEGEQWYFPIGYRPEPGDRATFDGFWIVDCGHEDFHTEVHPPQVVVSSYMQTAPYLPALGATWNRPKVADRYVPETKGLVPATITKIVLTPVWEGPTAEIDVWPPPRPDAGARLHHTGGIDRSSGAVVVSEVPLPANNPNHLHVTLRRVQPYLANRSLVTGGINNPDGNFLFLASYMLWWKEN